MLISANINESLLNKIFLYFASKRDKEIIKFDDIKIEKHKLHRYKSFIFLQDVDFDTH